MNKKYKKHYEKFFEKEKKVIKLTSKQKELINILAKGNTLKETADILDTTYNNIQRQTQILYRKLGVHNRATLILKCLNLNIIKTKDITNTFRKRFSNTQSQQSNDQHVETLNNLEQKYLQLIANGYSKKAIIKELNLTSIYACNCIQATICNKLSANNITHAIFLAIKSKIITI